jgi:hypothetical protein
MGGSFSIFVGVAVMGIAVNMGHTKPYDWLTTPAQRYMEENPGNKDMSINYAPTISQFSGAEDYKRITGSDTFRKRALAYQGANSRDPAVKQQSVSEMVRNNRRWGSGAIGDSVTYST